MTYIDPDRVTRAVADTGAEVLDWTEVMVGGRRELVIRAGLTPPDSLDIELVIQASLTPQRRRP